MPLETSVESFKTVSFSAHSLLLALTVQDVSQWHPTTAAMPVLAAVLGSYSSRIFS